MPYRKTSSRLASLLPMLFFVLFLFGIREYTAAGTIGDLTLAVAAGVLCFAVAGVMIYHRYDRPHLCSGRRERDEG